MLDEAGRGVAGLSSGKPLALLSYLIVQAKAPREEVLGLLWGDVPEARARNAFRQALHRLRSALGENALPHDRDILAIAPEIAAATDVARFQRCLATGNYDQASEEYTGDFLAGLDVGESAFHEWRDTTSKQYKAKYRDALRTVIQNHIDSGDVSGALRRTAELSANDAGDADAATLYASTLLGAGRRAEALQIMESFEQRYQLDFGTTAPAAVREFVARLRRAREEPRGTGPTRQQIRFVGREPELSILLTRIRALERGAGSLVIVAGEAGAGKTRLIEEFSVRTLDVGPCLLLQGRERSPDAAIPYASIAEALRGVLDAPGLSGTGQHLLAEAARLLPQLRDQFALPPITDISDDAGRLRFYEGIAALFDSVAYEQPVCLALDDFHNCSPATLSLVAYLVERLRSAPILFAIAGRSTKRFSALSKTLLESVSRSGSADTGGNAARIEVGPLDEASAKDLIYQLADSSESDRHEIMETSGAIPFRIIEACERLRAGEKTERNLVRIRDVLWARLQRTGQAEQRLFVTVALFDRPISIRLLAAASHLPEKSALDAALSLEGEGLLLQRADGVTPAHDFSGEIALEGTGPAGRALLAGWAAEALERDGSGTSAELARLFTLAGRQKEAFPFSRAAALEAMSVGALDEARHHFETALSTAASREARAEVERLLGSIGTAHLRLSPGNSVTSEPAQAPKTDINESTPESAPSPTRSASAGNKNRSHWKIRLALAFALAGVCFFAFQGMTRLKNSKIPGTSLADTLVVARELNPRDTVIGFTTGQLGSPLENLEGATRHGLTRSWIDSLRLPWANPLPSPDGHHVAVERITKNGSELFVISMDKRDTIQLRTGAGDDFSNGWSPDGHWLLATHGETRPGGAYAAELFAYSVFRGQPRIALDTARLHSVVEAVWSPDGSHVAWSSRVGPQHQQDIFVSDADGANAVNLTNDPSEDYSVAWSPDGSTIAFTSERGGRAELYSENIATRELRQLTWEGAHADHAAFSPDARWLAYESTRDGNPAVYVMPARGGTGRNVASALERVELVRWRGRTIPYVDQVLVDVLPIEKAGASAVLLVRGLDPHGNPIPIRNARLSVLDPELLRIEGDPARSSFEGVRVRALGRGLARVMVSAGNWRVDTAFVPIGEDTIALLKDNFDGGFRNETWRALGDPAPFVANRVGSDGSAGLVAKSDREWESGVLSRRVFPMRTGLSADIWVAAPFLQPAAPRSFVVALVAADPAEVVDPVAPHFLRLATVSWLAEAGRISYGVGREVFTEPVSNIGGGKTHRFTISVSGDDAVAFYVDGRLRSKSTLRVRTAGGNSRAQLWLGSQATGGAVVFDDIEVRLQTSAPPRRK
ncbi:MAG: PD40 domain-containing protein [Gemmatimonadaceae bacterium]|nr:PD40 domain-containing protein [Gemmatimonadaceae bacterium]